MQVSSRELKRRERNDLRGSFWRRKVSPAILARDSWICHICGKPIESYMDEQGKRRGRYKSPHPMSPSIDHIVGHETGFDMRYLRAAHLGCNVRRGAPAREQGDPHPVGATQW